MLIETEKENISINQLIGQKKEELVVQGDVIVNDVKPDVLKIVSTNGIPCIYKKEIMEGKIELNGCVNTYIVYMPEDGESKIRSLNTSLDFTRYSKYR